MTLVLINSKCIDELGGGFVFWSCETNTGISCEIGRSISSTGRHRECNLNRPLEPFSKRLRNCKLQVESGGRFVLN